MNVLVRNDYRIEAVLSCDELSEFGITYDEIDYGNIETRRVLWALLDRIKSLYGISLSLSGKLLIEVIKESQEKIRICFSVLPPHGSDVKSVKQLIKSENHPVIAEFCEFEDVLSFLLHIPEDTASAFYEKNGKYRLVFYALPDEKNSILGKACEFSDIRENSAIEKARCEELWNCIIPYVAVRKLKASFSEKQ